MKRTFLNPLQLEDRLAPAAGMVPVGTQPTGGLTGKIAYIHGGHGYTADNLGNGSWSFQRGELFEMIEDLGNVDQMSFLADTLFRAGATVVPLRPVGHQTREVVLDNDSAGVTFTGSWSNSTGSVFYGSAGDIPYRYAATSLTETAYARYRPTIATAGFYPVYAWTVSGSNRATDQLYRINHTGGITEVNVNHRRVGNGLVYLGTYYFDAGTAGYVDISNRSNATGSYVIADMIRFGNGMGTINRGGGVSGLAREDEAGLYWIQWHVDRSQGIPNSEYRTSSDDRDATIGASPRYAEYMNREADGALKDRVFVSYHSNAAGGRGVVGLHNGTSSSSSTPNQYLLANTLGAEINNDMVAQAGAYEHNWDDNGTNVTFQHPDYAFGEINNSVIDDEFDATIVEVAFHDNELDAELMRDPKVRDAVARATYQGLIKYFRAVDANTTPSTSAPAAVTNLRVSTSTSGSVTLNWTAPATNAYLGSAAASYRVYASVNGYGFDGGTAVTGTSATLTGYDPSLVYYFKVVAVNAGGESPGSEVVAVIPAGGPKQILIVNGFDRLERSINPTQPYGSGANTIERVRPRESNSRDYVIQAAEAVCATRPGVRVESTSNEAVISGAVNLNSYDTVIWITGEESGGSDSFDATEQTKVEAFIAAGGNFFTSGAEIGWDLDYLNNGRPFYENTLKSNYVADDANTYAVTGLAGGIFVGLSFNFDDGTLFYDSEYADVINPMSGAIAALRYGTSADNAAIQAPGTGGRGSVVVFGFPFETITTSADRTAVMDRVLTYFGVSPPDLIAPTITSITSHSANGTYSTGESIGITVNFSEPVTLAGGMLNLALDSGAVVAVSPFSGSSVTATYVIQTGQASPDLTVTGITLATGATLKDEAGNSAVLSLPSSNLGSNANLIVNPPPPTVSVLTVNLGEIQRSRITTVSLQFSSPVNAASFASLGAIALTRTLGGPPTVVQTGATGDAGRVLVSPSTGSASTLVLTFDNANGAPASPGVLAGSLANGRWQLTVPSHSYSSPLNDPNLRRLYGDADANGSVDASDFANFGDSFGGSSIAFDFDGNGSIDASDFAAFGAHFSMTL